MAKSRRLLATLTGLLLSAALVVETGMTAQAGSNKNYLDELNGGVAAILDPGATNTTAKPARNPRKSENYTRTAAAPFWKEKMDGPNYSPGMSSDGQRTNIFCLTMRPGHWQTMWGR